MIIYLAALLGVRPELYDAAEVDGASIWQKIRYITLPQIRNVLFVTLILQLIATAQLFTEPLLFTGGGPANSTLTVLLLIYRYAFQNSLGGDYGMAAALSLMLAAFLSVFTIGLLLADPALEHGLVTLPAATRGRLARSIPSRSAASSRRPTIASAGSRWTMTALQGRHPAVPARRRARAAAVDGQVIDHADPGHAAHADGAVAQRLRPVAAGDGLDARPHRPLPVEHDLARVRLVGGPDRGRDDGRLRLSVSCAHASAGS